MNVSSRVIASPRNRNPSRRGNASRSVGTADAISSSLVVVLNRGREFAGDLAQPEAVLFESLQSWKEIAKQWCKT
jgi:hypothetical protein